MRMLVIGRKGVWAALCLLAAGSLPAADYTWQYAGGSAPTNWSNKANWLCDGKAGVGYPKGGDRAIFPSTLTKETVLQSETVNLGSGELTLQVDTTASKDYVFLYTIFTGSAKIVRTGVGRMQFGKTQGVAVNNLWTGGLEVRNGRTSASGGGKQTFGTGTVTIRPESDSSTACIGPGCWVGIAITNRVEIEFSGLQPRTTAAKAAISTSNSGSLSGPVFADSDFAVYASGVATGTFTFNGPIEAAGQTLYAHVAGGSAKGDQGYIRFNDALNASLVMQKCTASYPHCRVILGGQSDNVENTITIIDGTNEFASADAYWGGTSISINPNYTSTSPRLKVMSSFNLNPDVEITLLTGGFIEVPAGVGIRVHRLTIDGLDVGTGRFTGADYPCIAGGGWIDVETATWIGGSEGKWSDSKNWTGGDVPKAGELAYFPSSVRLEEEEVDFGEAEYPERVLTVNVGAGVTVTNSAVFSGDSGIVKTGAGTWTVMARQTYAGGTVVQDGFFTVQGVYSSGNWVSSYPGTGTIEIRRSAACLPHLVLSSWTVVSNRVLITGPYRQDAADYGDITFNSIVRFYGDVELGDGADAFRLHNQYNNLDEPLNFYGDVSARDRMMYVTSCADSTSRPYDANTLFYGVLDASVRKSAEEGHLEFMPGSRVGAADSAETAGSTLEFLAATNVAHAAGDGSPAASILAQTVTVDGAAGIGTALWIRSSDNFPQTVNVRLTNGGKLIVDGGVRATLHSLTVDGTEVPRGSYTAKTLPAALAGEGVVRVGSSTGGLFIFR